MSQQVLEEVLRKASSDVGFRARLKTDFEGAIKAYDLTDREKQQLRAEAGAAAEPAEVRRAAEAVAEENELMQSDETNLMEQDQ